MTDRQLECIATIAKHQSLTKAAKELFVSQSSLSQMLTKTEKELGVSLFNRTATAMIPTYAGEVYLKAAMEISDIKRGLEEQLAAGDLSRRGRLTVALSTNRSTLYMPEILPKYMSQLPNVEVVVDEEDRAPLEELILNGKADVAIMAHPRLHPGLEYQYLCKEYLSLVLPVSWEQPLLRPDHTVDLSCLKEQNFILVKNGHDIRSLTDRAFSDALFNPKILLESHSLEVCFQLAGSGMGATLVPDTLVTAHAKRNAVQCYRVGDAYSRHIAIVYKTKKHSSLILSEFLEIASSCIIKIHGQASSMQKHNGNPQLEKTGDYR